jgi:hypothetical protein
VLSSAEGDPVLATRQYGLGKSVAWTSDARQRWSAAWLGWSGFSKFWAQTVRWSMRQSSGSDLQTLVDIDKGRGKITVEAVDPSGNFINFLNPKARLVTPKLKGLDLPLEQTGPGRYEADFDARDLGTYLINIRTQRGNKTVSQITGATLPYSPEYNAVGSDLFLLSQVAEQSGGEQVAADKVFTRPRTPARMPQDLWLPLLMIAACLFPLDVAVRRLMWGESEWRGLQERVRNRQARSDSGASTQREQSMDRLLKTKQRGPASTQTAANQAPSTSTSAGVAPGKLPTATVPPPPGGAPSTASPPTTNPSAQAAQPAAAAQTSPPSTSPTVENTEEGELDPMERLRRAKRRARGEE